MALDIIARGMAADSIKCVSQDLTEEQKAIARNNIGASGGSEDLKNAVQVIPQNFTEAQKQQARDNIGAVSISSFDAAEADIVDLFAETAALGQKTPSASQGSFIINEMTRSNSLSIDPATGGLFFNVIPSGGVSEASGEWSVSNEITFEKGTISTPGEYTFFDSFQGAGYLKLIPGKSYVMYIKYISGTIPANLENWAFTFSSGGKTVSMNLNNSLPVEVFVPVAGDLAFGGRFTPNGVADPSITFDEVNKYTVQILMVEVNNGSNQGAIVHNNDLNNIESKVEEVYTWATEAAPRLDNLNDNTVQVNTQTFTEEQKTQARTNIGAASQTSLDNDIANCVQIKAQSLTNDQKTQARTNIGALSSADLSVWSQRTTGEEDLNALADAGYQKAYISRYTPSTANTPVANTYGNVISLRNAGSELTQLAMGAQYPTKLFYRGSSSAGTYGTWKEVDTIAQKGETYIVYTSGLKIQWGEANIPSQIETGTVITPTIKLSIAMTTGTYKITAMCTNSNANFGYDSRQANSFVLGIRNLGSAVITTNSSYSWVVIGY